MDPNSPRDSPKIRPVEPAATSARLGGRSGGGWLPCDACLWTPRCRPDAAGLV